MSPRRVRHIVKGLGPGGAERLIVTHVCADRSETVHDVIYLLAHKDHLVPELRAAGINTSCVESRLGTRLGWIWRIRHRLRRDPTDVVHVHSPAVAVAVRLIRLSLPRSARPTLVGTEHNRWPRHRRLTRLANRFTIRLEDATIAVSDDVAATVRGTRPHQLRTVEHGIDVDAVRASGDRRWARTEMGAAEDDFAIVCVANFRREKALEVLVDAARQALSERARLRFVLIGQGPLASDIDGWVDAAGISDRFTVLGYRADAARVISGADVLTLSSRHEGLPVTIMEAFAHGVPVVATAAGGIPDAVGDAGIVTPVGDAASLARGYLALESDAERRNACAAAATIRSERFSVRRAITEIEEVYDAAVTRRRSRHRSSAAS